MKPTILLLFAAFAFTACSRYDYYWHEEEDDVYFISQTPEEVDIYSVQRDRDDDEDLDTYDDNRTRTPDYDPQPRRDRRNTIYYPTRRRTDRSTRTTTPRTTKPNTTTQPKTSPAPKRAPRPRSGSSPKTNPK